MQKNKSLEKLAKTSTSVIFDVPETNSESYQVFFAREFIGESGDAGFLLDLGCNYGSFLLNFDRFGAIGIDLRREPLSAFKKYSEGKYSLIQASGTNLPFRDSVFDVVFLWDVIEHVPVGSELTLFREVNRLLSKSGILLMSTPSNNLISIITDPAYFLRRHRHYSLNEIQRMLQLTNFDSMRVSKKGNLLTVIAINLLYFRKWILRSKVLDGLQKMLDEINELNERSKNQGNLEWYVAASKI